ncbi:MAG: putative cupredoxin-like copper-binding protein [Candidatus Azotimanducaceae bacterium]|jgi:uncharacterized cupredoxin-like copper-binding protein
MKNLLLTTALAFTFAIPAYAGGTHAKKHDEVSTEKAEAMMVGMPGDSSKVDRTVNVILLETDDGEMLIKGDDMTFKKGETILFKIKNEGEQEHEFVLDTVENNAKHKIEMAKMVMEHDDPNRITLDSGASGEVVWTFSNDGTFEAACLIPGHYESGMHREVSVSMEMAEMKMAQADVVYTKGTITKVDAKGGKVTIDHGPLLNLDMPAMKMVFRADEAMISKMSEGQNIEFVAEPVKGKLTVTQLK